MKRYIMHKGALLAFVLTVGFSVQAAEFILESSNLEKARSGSDVVLVGFSGDSTITDAQLDVNYDPAAISVSVKAMGSAGCSNPRPGLIRVASPDLGGKALGEGMGAYCQITVKSLKGPIPQNALVAANAFCFGVGGVDRACSAENVSLK